MAGEFIDFASRYADKLVPSDPAGGSWRDREQRLQAEINQGPDETAAGFAYHFNDRYVRNIEYLMASGNMAEAKKYYDDVRAAVKENSDLLLSISQMTDAGQIADDLAQRATGILRGDFNQQKVTMSDGSEVTIGQALADGSPYLAERSDTLLKRLQFSDAATQLYLDNDPTIKNIVDPMVRGPRGGGVDTVSNRIQLRALADAYAQDAGRINGLFADGTGQFIDYVKSTHRTSGNAAATMKTLVDFADGYSRATGKTGTQLATEVVGGYNDLLSAVFAGDPDPKTGRRAQPEVTDDQRRTFDAVMLPAVRTAMDIVGGAFDMHDPRFRQSMLEVMDTMAYVSAFGGDMLMQGARRSGQDINGMFGRYVAEAMTGQRHMPDNIVTAVRGLRAQLGARLTGGRDFAEVAASLTGQSRDYLANLDKSNGTKSTCPAADGIAADAHTYLAREMLETVTDGKGVSAAFGGIAGNAAVRQGLSERLSSWFQGRGGRQVADMLAHGIIGGLASGDRVNIEEMMGDLCFGEASRHLSSDALRSARKWYHGNVAARLRFSDQRTALYEKYIAEGFTDAQARRAVAQLMEQVSGEADRPGGNPQALIDRAMDFGRYLTEVPVQVPFEDKDGNIRYQQKKDPVTNKPEYRVEVAFGPRSEVPVRYGDGAWTAEPGVYKNDRVGWDAVQMHLEETRRRKEAQADYEARRRIAQTVRESAETF